MKFKVAQEYNVLFIFIVLDGIPMKTFEDPIPIAVSMAKTAI